ncbi:MAG: KEOPS complex subunit Pcc1 [Candidatus Verstraetearchaeota archaeon]|nr:KEOPS complex subunit Pcc1 [Candidatus Verstraetearchaeota archaeon]
MEREYGDPETARVVMRSLMPDNRGTPVGTEIEMSVSGKKLVVKVVSTDDLRSLIRTVDDILSCLQSAERAISSLEGDSAPAP